MRDSDVDELLTELRLLEIAEPTTDASEGPSASILADGNDPFADSHRLEQQVKAVVNSSSIISFVDGLAASEKSDIIDATQFAERAADAKHDRSSQIRQWYACYMDVLTKLGWVAEGGAFRENTTDSGTLDMRSEALSIISAIATGNQLAILTSSLEALGSMASESREIRMFDFNTSIDVGGNFQIGAAETAGDGVVSMSMGAFYYRSDDRRKNVLFVTWGTHDVEFWTSANRLTLDTKFYAQLRDTIRSRLGTASRDLIAEIPII